MKTLTNMAGWACLLTAVCGPIALAEEAAPLPLRQASLDSAAEEGVAGSATATDEATSVAAGGNAVYDRPLWNRFCTHVPGQDSRWLLNFDQTFDYVTNLALPFSLTPENASVLRDDFQFQTKAGALYRLIKEEDASLAVGYNYYQNLHPVVKELDLISHNLVARYEERVSDRLLVSVGYNYFYWYLDQVSYVSQHLGDLSALLKLDSQWDGKITYKYLRADFRVDPNLSSNNNAAQLELIRYLGGDRGHWLSGGYVFGRSDAVLNSFSYTGNGAFLAWHLLGGCCKRNEWLLLATYNNYNFDGLDVVEPTVHRVDNVWSFTPRYTRHVTKCLDLFAQYTLYASTSSVVRQNYTSNLVSTGLDLRW